MRHVRGSRPMTHTITLIPGDGIGPEVTDAVLRILDASGVSITWERHVAGFWPLNNAARRFRLSSSRRSAETPSRSRGR